MKKTILAITIATIAANIYAFDPDTLLKTVGNVAEYTKTEYTITQKFGDYYRSPKAKYVHSFASNGKEAEQSELTTRDSIVDKVTYAYDASGNIGSKICTDADGKVQWKIVTTYDGSGNKVDESEFNATDVLMNKSIWKYSGKQSEEALYNTDGALLGKTITKYDDQGRKADISVYNADGLIEEKQTCSYNDAGKLSEVIYSNSIGKQIKRVVYRFDSSYSITEKQTYNGENKLSIREIYKYDSNGNISKATTYAVSEKFGGTVNELTGINEYSYKYGTGSAKLTSVNQTSEVTTGVSEPAEVTTIDEK